MAKVYAVAGDGSIDFAFAGRVVIAELTVDEAARKLEEVLEERFFKEANVDISIANFVEGDVLVTNDPWLCAGHLLCGCLLVVLVLTLIGVPLALLLGLACLAISAFAIAFRRSPP